MKLLLTAISGSREGKTFTIEPNKCLTFGRTSASDWSFEDDGHMSSVHFEVANLGDSAEVRDRGSTNGTWLNNQKIQSQKLREGDRLRAGKTVLTVEFMQPLVQAEVVGGTHVKRPSDDMPTPPVESFEDFRPQPLVSNPEPPPPSLPPLSEPARPAPLPLPQTDRVEHAKAINPFDSIDFVDESSPFRNPTNEPGPRYDATPYTADEDRLNSPISDSSFSFHVPDAIDPFPTSPKSPISSGVSEHQLLERRTSVEAADGYAVILDSLARTWSIQLVVHFQKIRTTPPVSTGKPLFTWLNEADARDYSPLRMPWNEVSGSADILPLLPRLCRADACLAFFSRSSVGLGGQLDQILTVGVDGFSEPGGFLPVCWPSGLVDDLGRHCAERLSRFV
ncbi:MAG: FHA domain-containing protein [Pirellulaceae bacterium]